MVSSSSINDNYLKREQMGHVAYDDGQSVSADAHIEAWVYLYTKLICTVCDHVWVPHSNTRKHRGSYFLALEPACLVPFVHCHSLASEK